MVKCRYVDLVVTGKVPLAGFGWAMATHLSMYPVFLFIPVCTLPLTLFLIIVIKKQTFSICLFIEILADLDSQLQI